MFDIIKGYIQLAIQFINSIFYIEIDIHNDFKVYLGVLVIVYVVVLLILYFILKSIGVIDKE